ncbi:MAG: beta-galactosidase, partial [Terriglobales bacterium]
MPRLVQEHGRYSLYVDGQPFFILGGQIHNSSAWPGVLPQVWPALEFIHANTVEAPIYWEQLEAQPGQFDFANVDAVVAQAREHKLRVVLLWFGTWKNARCHYVPEWIKTDTAKYPRLIDASGRLTDSLSPFDVETLEADKRAFAALMRHLKEIDGERHTVLMVQVENEPGSLDSVRDFSPAAQKSYFSDVPAALTRRLNLPAGTWDQVFG